MRQSYDCIVIGGGPAGSTVAALVAEAGHSTLLLERERLPRFHVGESLMPETYWSFQRLGVLDKMKNSRFVRKLSVQFVSHTGKESQPFFFLEHDPRECSQTWQVERAEFDKMLFDNALEKGAEGHDRTRVLDVVQQEGRVCGVRLQQQEQPPRTIQSRVVVDATGQQALLAHRLGLRVDYPHLKKAAVWGYYRHAYREPGDHGGATVILLTEEKRSWFWNIPLSNDVTSVGVVGDHDYLLKERGQPALIFQQELAKCPAMAERLKEAQLDGAHRVAKEFSYFTKQRAGEGWVLVGDAYGFIDPIYSSGVYFALRSGELAADAINQALAADQLSAEQLGAWSPEFDRGVQWIKKLVEAYYDDGFSFGRFMRDHPQHQGNLTDLLIGRIFHDGAGRIFHDMQPLLRQADSSG